MKKKGSVRKKDSVSSVIEEVFSEVSKSSKSRQINKLYNELTELTIKNTLLKMENDMLKNDHAKMREGLRHYVSNITTVNTASRILNNLEYNI